MNFPIFILYIVTSSVLHSWMFLWVSSILFVQSFVKKSSFFNCLVNFCSLRFHVRNTITLSCEIFKYLDSKFNTIFKPSLLFSFHIDSPNYIPRMQNFIHGHQLFPRSLIRISHFLSTSLRKGSQISYYKYWSCVYAFDFVVESPSEYSVFFWDNFLLIILICL